MATNSVIIPHSKTFAYVKVLECRLEWPVKSDQLASSASWAVTSPTFSPGSNNEFKWCMKLYPGGRRIRGNVALDVCFVPSTQNAVLQGKFTLSILNDHGIQLNVKELSKTHTFVAGTNADTCGFDNVMRHASLRGPDGITVNTNLTIVCEIKGVSNVSHIPGKNDAIPFSIPEYRFPDNLRSLFETKKFSDVTLIMGNQAIRAHKVVLAMYSNVFSAMFGHKMTEQIHNEVKIADVTPTVFNEMLRYMYTGEVNGIETIADLLLVAADKYDLQGLKAMCEEALCKNISVKNAADILILADKHNANQLKPRVLRFIAALTTNVMATAGFDSMVQSHPHLVVETLRELALRKNDELRELMAPAIDEDIVPVAASGNARM